MSIAILKSILIPPYSVKANSLEAWDNVESKLGIRLPIDYKQFVDNYGAGSIDEYLMIYSPFACNDFANLFSEMENMLWAYRVMKQDFPQDYKYEAYPSLGGILPWGITIDGDEIYWLTKGNPNTWQIVVHDRSDLYEYKMGMVSFLSGILTRQVVYKPFPEDFPSENPKFFPAE